MAREALRAARGAGRRAGADRDDREGAGETGAEGARGGTGPRAGGDGATYAGPTGAGSTDGRKGSWAGRDAATSTSRAGAEGADGRTGSGAGGDAATYAGPTSVEGADGRTGSGAGGDSATSTSRAGAEGAAGRRSSEAGRDAATHAGRAGAEGPDRAARRPTGPATRVRRGARGALGGAAEVRGRAVRELLGDAFRMPGAEDAAAEELAEPDADRSVGGPARAGGDAPGMPEPEDRVGEESAEADRGTPRSMAAPGRDGELRRTFDAFPGRPSGGDRFAETWWGNAWVTALEEGALDAKRLVRGRAYAEQGHVDAITVTPGLVLAYVRGSRPRPYRVQVRLRTLGDAGWERFLEAAAERPGHIAALLDKELPQSLADCGAPLLPGPGDLEPRCSCPDSGHPCKHAAALCYQTARLLDADPFVLLLLRGRGERDLLDALSRRSATRAARAAQEQKPAPLPGVRATDAVAPRRLPPLPAPLPVPPHPGQPPVYPAAPGGPDPFALDQLATDAAARAHALLATGRDPVGELTLWQDAVRLAAARPGSGLTAGSRALYSSLASAAGRTPAELARAVAAWRQGGLEGLSVLDEPWDPPAGRFDRARPLLLAADLPAFRPWRNHLTHPRGHVQLRLGRDGLWYAYESEPGRDDWWPRGTPDLDPVGALTGLGAASDL
ncbi:SWIM zinc finger family protein [Streptomyces sp. NPDC087903]|uniref:SWIM zinc finger family protein n=1 Tax=Streptomyces sp. NPDC087903 TaxID=3365819 RepID=UPI003815F954